MARDRQKKGMPRNLKCKYCNKAYAMGWALQNHEKNCREKDER